jgi:hypothetical protein
MDAKKAVTKHENNMHPGKKTTFKKGGVTSAGDEGCWPQRGSCEQPEG